MSYNINNVLSNETLYNELMEYLFISIEDNFHLRRNTVEVVINDEVYELSRANLLTNLIAWKPFVTFNETLTKDYIMDCSCITADVVNGYMERLREKFFTVDRKYKLNVALAEIIEGYGALTYTFNKYIGNSISNYSFYQLSKNNSEFKDIIYTELDPDKSPKELEDELAYKTKVLIDILKNEPNAFRDYLLCNEGININQLTQYMIAVGPKPDLNGNVYPTPVKRSILRGFNSVSDYYIDATGGRKALITNFDQVKKSGYISRKLTLLCMNTLLDTQQDDCGSTDYINLYVTEDVLKRINGRWILDETTNEEYMVSSKDNKDLVGTTVKLRSPITCKGHGNKICKKCYGHLSDINYDIHIGKFGVDVLGSQLTQMLLSTKHLLKTISEVIEWNKLVLDYFRFDGNAILIGKEYDTKESIIFDVDNVLNDDNEGQPITEFIIRREVKGKLVDSVVKLTKEIFLSEYMLDLVKENIEETDNGKISEVKLKDIDVEEILFYFIINNSEMITHLKNLIELIESKDHLGITDKHEFMNKFADLLASSGIKIDLVHTENIVRELLRSNDNLTKRNYNDGEYTILRVTDAILNSSSIVNSLSFEQIKKQLLSPSTYDKTDSSYLDVLFK